MIKKKKLLVGFVTIAVLAAAGQMSLRAAGTPVPGTNEDPIISLSYFNQEVEKVKAELLQKIAAVETELAASKKELEAAKKEIVSLKAELSSVKAGAGGNAEKNSPDANKPKEPAQSTQPEASNPKSEAAKLGYGVVTANSLNVRDGAGTNFKKIGTLVKNNKVSLLAKQGEWYKISYGKITGWVHGQYIKKV